MEISDLSRYQALSSDYERLMFLAMVGSLAPSGHNVQPWLFKINGNKLQVIGNKKKWLQYADRHERQYHISLGAALQNIISASEALGLVFQYQILLEENIIAEISFNQLQVGANVDNGTLSAINSRHNNRFSFTAEPLNGNFLNQLNEYNFPDIKIQVIQEAEQKSKLSEIILQSIKDAFKDKNFSKELGKWTKPSLPWYKDGLPGYNLNMPFLISFFIPTLLKLTDFGEMQYKIHKPLLDTSQALVVISTEKDTPNEWVRCGQALEKIWLNAEKSGVRLGVLAASVETNDDYKRVQGLLNISSRPQVMFRLGHSLKVPKKCPRIPITQLIVK